MVIARLPPTALTVVSLLGPYFCASGAAADATPSAAMSGGNPPRWELRLCDLRRLGDEALVR